MELIDLQHYALHDGRYESLLHGINCQPAGKCCAGWGLGAIKMPHVMGEKE